MPDDRDRGRDVTASPPAARDVAMVFQQFSLYPHFTVFDNLAFPCARRCAARARAASRHGWRRSPGSCASTASSRTGRRASPAARCSASRSAARSCADPHIYLMDEPLSSLDAKLREDLRIELKRIQRELRATILYVTHDQIEAMTMADRIGVIEEGRLLQLASPREIYERPGQRRRGATPGFATDQPVASRRPPGRPGERRDGWRAARGRHARCRRDRRAVEQVEPLGAETVVLLQLPGARAARAPARARPHRAGSATRVAVASRAMIFFAADGRRLAA